LSDYVKQIDTPTYKLLKRALPGPLYLYTYQVVNHCLKYLKRKKQLELEFLIIHIALAIVEELGNPIISTSIHDEDDVRIYYRSRINF